MMFVIVFIMDIMVIIVVMGIIVMKINNLVDLYCYILLVIDDGLFFLEVLLELV